MKFNSFISKFISFSSMIFILSSCSGNNENNAYRTSPEYDSNEFSVTKDSGITLLGFGKGDSDGTDGAVAVNAFLWRAALDTISFMPLASADPYGGIIISDWHALPESPDERFKVNIYILGRLLRADGIKASVFRQVREGESWKDSGVGDEVSTEFEDAILTRARKLRMQAVIEDK